MSFTCAKAPSASGSALLGCIRPAQNKVNASSFDLGADRLGGKLDGTPESKNSLTF
jgi:hypothetical protein